MAWFAATDVAHLPEASEDGLHVYEVRLFDGARGRVHADSALSARLVAAALSFQMRFDTDADAAYRLSLPEPLWLDEIIAPVPELH